MAESLREVVDFTGRIAGAKTAAFAKQIEAGTRGLALRRTVSKLRIFAGPTPPFDTPIAIEFLES